MKRSKFIIGLTATALVLPLGAIAAGATEVPPSSSFTQWTEWVSDDGGSAGRELPAISADGRYVVFVGRSADFGGVYVKDRANPSVLPVLVASGDLVNPDISADGSTVVWTQLGSGSKGGQAIYMKKWQAKDAAAIMVSLGDDGQPPDSVTDFPSVSGNGRYVAFQSMDMTLDEQAVPGKKGGNRTKAYVRDTVAGTTEMVSVVGTNTIPNGSGIKPDITPDGRYVAFASDSTDLQALPDTETETTTYQQVYRRDRVAKTTIPVSVNKAGELGNGASSTVYGPTISDDGMTVAFESGATNLVDGDTNADIDAFVRKVGLGQTGRVSLNVNGAQFDTPDDGDVAEVADDPATTDVDESASYKDGMPVGLGPAISGDGDYVAFESQGILTTDDVNDVKDVYRYGLSTAKKPGTTRWSVKDDPADAVAFEATGTRTDGHSGATVPAINGTDPAIAADGSRIAFVSQGNLTGRVVEAEEGETTATTSIEPNVYLHRPNPEPDSIAPTSKARSKDVATTSPIKVYYKRSDAGFPRTGVVAVRLYVKKPGATKFKWVQTDRGAKIDKVFKVKAVKDGRYKFYTRARDAAGNLEAAPGSRDDMTKKR